MSEKAARSRISLTLTKVYIEALDKLVDMGIYMEHQAAIRDALRRFFQFHGIEPFTDKETELEPEDSE